MSFQLRLLGYVELYVDRTPVRSGPAKRRAALAALALDANQPVSLDRLIEAVWAGLPPRSAVANLRTHIAALRRLLGDRIVAVPGGYLLRVNAGEVDVHGFQQLTESGRVALDAGDADLAVRHLTAALGLWHGDAAGEGLPRGTHLDVRFASLDEGRLNAFEDLVEAKLALAEHGDVLPGLRQHLAHHPLRERAWGQLMLALYRGGDVAAALTAYQAARGALREQLGVEPGAALVALQRAVLERDPALSPALPEAGAAAGISGPWRSLRQLPLDTADIAVRAAELAEELAAFAAAIRRSTGARGPKAPWYDCVRAEGARIARGPAPGAVPERRPQVTRS